jgi:hypothetical protein
VAPRGRTTSLDSTGGSLQRTNSATQTVEWMLGRMENHHLGPVVLNMVEFFHIFGIS